MLKRLAIKGMMTYIAVFALMLMVAMPALALLADSVKSPAIVNGQVLSRDIGFGEVTSKDIRERAVEARDIGKRAVKNGHIGNDAVVGRQIKNGTIANVDISPRGDIAACKINTAGLNADTVDGVHAVAFARAIHDHDRSYSVLAHGHDTSYSVLGHSTPWSPITNVPQDLADGDDDTMYQAGFGLFLSKSRRLTRSPIG